MKSKLGFLTGVSLKRKVKTKWFILANVILALAIIGIINIDHVINFFGGDFNKKEQIYIIDNTNECFDTFKKQLAVTEEVFKLEDSSYEVHLYKKSEKEATDLASKDEKNTVIVFDLDDKTVIKAKVISEGYIDTIDYQLLTTSINSTKSIIALSKSSISVEELNKISAPLDIERVILDETKKTESENMETIMSMIFPIFILPFFMLTIFLVQMIGAEVNDEKTTRGMEIIISNVSPKTHFFSKVFAGNIFVLLQGGLLIVFGAVGLLLRSILGGGSVTDGVGEEVMGIVNSVITSDFVSSLIYIIPLALVLMVLTFIAYSLLAGILASITTNIEDFQQLQTPIIVILLIGYFLATMAGMFEGSIFIRIISYIPLISAILSPSLLVLGQIGIIDILVSIILLIGTNYLLIKYGLKIYKVGILNYSSTGLWKKMFKALKN